MNLFRVDIIIFLLLLVTLKYSWQAHLPCLEGSTSPYPGSISVYFVALKGVGGWREHVPRSAYVTVSPAQKGMTVLRLGSFTGAWFC